MAYPVNTKTFTRYLDGEFLVSESDWARSREQVLYAPNAALILSGTIMGQITSSGLYTPCNPAATDGSQNAIGLNYYGMGINTGNTRGALIARGAEVNGKKIFFGLAANQGQKDAMSAALKALGILVRY